MSEFLKNYLKITQNLEEEIYTIVKEDNTCQ